MNSIKTRFVAGLAALLLAAPAAHAQPAVSGFTGGSQFNIFYGGSTGDVVGFTFTAVSDFSVTHLGVYAPSGSLNSSHEVGLWSTLDQVLLGSVIVTPASELTGDWRYTLLGSAISLTGGTQYTLGAMYSAYDGDDYVSNPSTIDLDSRITGTAGVAPTQSSLGFTFPGTTSANLARLGPNMIISTTTVPEPSTYVLMATGLIALGVAGRRRKRSLDA